MDFTYNSEIFVLFLLSVLLLGALALAVVVKVILECCYRVHGLLPPSPNRGLDKRVLNSLPKLTFSAASASASEHKLDDCPICLAEFEEGEELRLLPDCGHGYHVVCIDTWLASHSTCPSCRQIYGSSGRLRGSTGGRTVIIAPMLL